METPTDASGPGDAAVTSAVALREPSEQQPPSQSHSQQHTPTTSAATPDLAYYVFAGVPRSGPSAIGSLAQTLASAAPANNTTGGPMDMGGLQNPPHPMDHEDPRHTFAVARDDQYGCWSQDAMDLDYDPDLASWVNSWDASLVAQQCSPQHPIHPHPHPHPHHQQMSRAQSHTRAPKTESGHDQLHLQQPPPTQQSISPEVVSRCPDVASVYGLTAMPMAYDGAELVKGDALGPDDYLFPDDEMASSVSGVSGELAQRHISDPPDHQPNASFRPLPSVQPALDLNDSMTLKFYDQMLLFSRGHSANERLVFDSCDPLKEAILHRLAMKLKLSYSYDPVRQTACVWDTSLPQPVPSAPMNFAQQLNVPTQLPPPSQPLPQPPAAVQVSQPAGVQSTLPSKPKASKRVRRMPSAPFPLTNAIKPTAVSIPAGSAPPTQPLPTPPPSTPFQLQQLPPTKASTTQGNKQRQQPPLVTATAPSNQLSHPQQNTNTASVPIGLTSPASICPSSDASSTNMSNMSSISSLSAASAASALVLSGNSNDGDDRECPSLSDRLSNSWNIFHSGISSRRPRGRRGPLSAKSRKDIKDLEWAGGACWRCKILRRKCDPGAPCKNCPPPDLREDAPPWPLIGCRRGNLRDAMPPQALCTKSSSLLTACSRKMPAILAAENVGNPPAAGPLHSQPVAVLQCLREAKAQFLSDNKLVLDNPSLYLRARQNSAAAQHFSESVRNGRYRQSVPMNTTCHVYERAFTYADLIVGIAWDLADNPDYLSVLEIESITSFMLLLESACQYEAEVGKSPMVALSMVCLRCCIDALRLHSAGLLNAQLHTNCQGDRCCIDCHRELSVCIENYLEELSLLMFRKANLRDRRWWLSTFYSLCIQAYVRRALLVIEQRLLYSAADDVDVLFSSQYLHLITVLFIAVSFQYDPLLTNSSGLRLQQSLLPENDGSSTDLFVPDRYFSAGRTACAVDLWPDEGIKSSYQFLTRLLNIGSLDFDMAQVDLSGGGGGSCDGSGVGDVHMEGSDAVLPMRRPRGLKSDQFSTYSPPASSATSFTSSFSASLSVSGIMSSASSGPIPSTASSRASVVSSESRNSVGSLPSQLSIATFSSSQPTGAEVYGSRLPPPATSHPSPYSSQQSTSASGVTPTTGSIESAAAATAAAAAVAADGGAANADGYPGEGSSGMGLFVCSCCPKRPQRFETMEALKGHQTKKPHICAFCGRRFSRMNEAERHITTIHLRPFSWSCRRLTNPLLAFQRMSDGTTSYDVCGFCGKQFPRDVINNVDQKTTITTVTAKHVASLTTHIEVDHKLHECKASSKKFYREDMFGQHLKLSHAAEPGMWLKYLENVCKADEKQQVAAALAGNDIQDPAARNDSGL